MAWRVTHDDGNGTKRSYALTIDGRFKAAVEDDSGFVKIESAYAPYVRPEQYELANQGKPSYGMNAASGSRSILMADWRDPILREEGIFVGIHGDSLAVPNRLFWDDNYGAAIEVKPDKRGNYPDDIPGEESYEMEDLSSQISALESEQEESNGDDDDGEAEGEEGGPRDIAAEIARLEAERDKLGDAWSDAESDVEFEEGQSFVFPRPQTFYHSGADHTVWMNIGYGSDTLQEAWESWEDYQGRGEQAGGNKNLPEVLRPIEDYDEVLAYVASDLATARHVVATFVDAARELAAVASLAPEVFELLYESRDVETLQALAENPALPVDYLEPLIASFPVHAFRNPSLLLLGMVDADKIALSVVGEEAWALYEEWASED